MATRFFTFIRDDYEKYGDFSHMDPGLDYFASAFLSKDVVNSLRRAFRMSEHVYLKSGNDQYAEVSGGVAFYRALFSHWALKYWQPRVKSLELTDDIWNSPGAMRIQELGNIHPVQSISRKRFTSAMARATGGIFELPVRDMEIFPRTFILEYCAVKWLLEEGHTFFGAYKMDYEQRLAMNDMSLDHELSRLHQIVEQGY